MYQIWSRFKSRFLCRERSSQIRSKTLNQRQTNKHKTKMSEQNAEATKNSPESNEALKLLEEYRPNEEAAPQPAPSSPGSPPVPVVAEPVSDQPAKVDEEDGTPPPQPVAVQAVKIPVHATPVMRMVTLGPNGQRVAATQV
eukprot:augustus_masked-scaffold_3-processed-gene-21.93-mRNA-1 protein AED:1.00 eAED:1.00 QI:0/0/0/0/1/1/2/0/140